MHKHLLWLKEHIPAPIFGASREKLAACIGAILGLGLAEFISHLLFSESHPWFIATMGASSVLLFAIPASPLAQPWSVMGGNVTSAIVGVACAHWLGHSGAVAGLATGLAIAAMFSLRCLHPPGGSVAMMAVLGGPAINALGYQFALVPVALNSACLLITAVVFNNLVGRGYPHKAHHIDRPHGTADPMPTQRLGLTKSDLNKVIKSYDETLDVSREDLEEIFMQAQFHSYSRQFGEIRCAEIMSKDIVFLSPNATPLEAWQMLKERNLGALPVLDEQRRLLGIVTLRDLMTAKTNSLPTLLDILPALERLSQKV